MRAAAGKSPQPEPRCGTTSTSIYLVCYPRFRLLGLDDSMQAPTRRRVLRGDALMRGIKYNIGKSLAKGPLS